ncbi:BZ3500_MvSof-1268-A1-R1_Chr1-1g00974 [Microbotryum saponariae]|uniref:BZ3500_MvSof-1268-A1-R1_Chr1-1g00974 protein n=1 Tax=Microbotryum saponariae TaxID=289078 RepID=A0A2X0MML3_9BASI|nr:BZ3500_MvSof-1268-A1-R1_Chr1-1g00974 [Microbotryum saponariae]SCZ93075.1 BZ3501_MvSof-1269-A2-R1_Chr1-1g00571 [Microbotryum saponariae]
MVNPATRATRLTTAFLLFVSFALLLIVSVSCPVWNNIVLARGYWSSLWTDPKVAGRQVRYGLWGYCNGLHGCTKSTLGYARGWPNSPISSTPLGRVSKALVVLPVACGLTFAAFMMAVLLPLSMLATALLSFWAWVATFVGFGIHLGFSTSLRNRLWDTPGIVRAHVGNSIWLVLTSLILTTIASIMLCTRRDDYRKTKFLVSRHKDLNHGVDGVDRTSESQLMPASPTGKAWWARRNRDSGATGSTRPETLDRSVPAQSDSDHVWRRTSASTEQERQPVSPPPPTALQPPTMTQYAAPQAAQVASQTAQGPPTTARTEPSVVGAPTTSGTETLPPHKHSIRNPPPSVQHWTVPTA